MIYFLHLKYSLNSYSTAFYPMNISIAIFVCPRTAPSKHRLVLPIAINLEVILANKLISIILARYPCLPVRPRSPCTSNSRFRTQAREGDLCRWHHSTSPRIEDWKLSLGCVNFLLLSKTSPVFRGLDPLCTHT